MVHPSLGGLIVLKYHCANHGTQHGRNTAWSPAASGVNSDHASPDAATRSGKKRGFPESRCPRVI